MRTDLHITNNSKPEDWLPVIEAIKETYNGPFQSVFSLMVDGKPTLHMTSEFVVQLLEEYVDRRIGRKDYNPPS
jgi:hypothetical protein